MLKHSAWLDKHIKFDSGLPSLSTIKRVISMINPKELETILNETLKQYFYKNTNYYIDDELVTAGDVIAKTDSSQTYTIGDDVDKLTGVYNINKGYAVFKQINILTKNENYAIIETKTTYGISLYDHIALDGSKVKENQLVVK